MPIETETYSYVEDIRLTQEIEKKVAWLSVRVGDLLIHGVTVWRAGNGRLSVFFPSYKVGWGYKDAIELPPDLRAEIEADVIAAYKQAKEAAKESKGTSAR